MVKNYIPVYTKDSFELASAVAAIFYVTVGDSFSIIASENATDADSVLFNAPEGLFVTKEVTDEVVINYKVNTEDLYELAIRTPSHTVRFRIVAGTNSVVRWEDDFPSFEDVTVHIGDQPAVAHAKSHADMTSSHVEEDISEIPEVTLESTGTSSVCKFW